MGEYLFSVWLTSVAAAILAAVEGGILPPGINTRMSSDPRNFQRAWFCVRSFPPGWKPGSTAGKDARRYAKQLHGGEGWRLAG